MQKLVDGLRNAAGQPPPSSIDLDRLITAEYRRKRVLTGVTTAFAAVALVAAVAVPLVLTAGGGPDARPGPHIAAPATPCLSLALSAQVPATGDPTGGDPAVLRGQVEPCLAGMLPGATLTDPATRMPGVRFTGDRRDRYTATIQVDDAAGTGLLALQYLLNPLCRGEHTQPCTGPSNCPRAESGGTRCLVREDGTKLLIQESRTGGVEYNQLNVYRPDGSYLQLGSTNGDDPHGFITDVMKATATHAPLTSAQLVEIADVMRLDG